MRMRTSIVLALVALAGAAAWAQEAAAPTGPPPVLVISREEIKPGRMAVHERSASTFVSVLERAGSPEHRIALVPLSGDDNQVVYLTGFGSFADLEASHNRFQQALLANAALRAEMEALDRQGAEQHNTQKTSIARYRADLSYRPGTLEQVAQSRFLNVSYARIKIGRAPDYVEYVKALNAARQKAGVTDISNAVYQVVSGTSGPAFVTFTFYRSLKDLDDNLARMQDRQKAVDEALGGAEVVKQRRMLLSEIALDNTATLYALNPAISRPSPAFAAADPSGFWNPKPAAGTKALAVKKETKK